MVPRISGGGGSWPGFLVIKNERKKWVLVRELLVNVGELSGVYWSFIYDQHDWLTVVYDPRDFLFYFYIVEVLNQRSQNEPFRSCK